MDNRFKALLITALACLVLFNACEEPIDVGRDLIPDGDALVADTIETLLLPLNTISDSAVFTTSRGTAILGSVESSVFGNAYAGLYTEVGFTTQFDSSKTYILDSMVLYVRNTGYFGDSLIPQSFNILQMTDSIPGNTGFVANTSFPTSMTPIGTITNTLPSSDSTMIGNGLFPRHLSARLDDGLAQLLLDKLDDGSITNDSSLQSNFKGVYIEPETSMPGRGIYDLEIIPTNVGSNASGIQIFYRTTDMDTSSYLLDFSLANSFNNALDDVFFPGLQNHNRLWHDFSVAESELQAQLDTYDSDGYDQGYIKGGSGILALLELPDTQPMLDGFQVNTAQLTIEGIIDNPADTLFLPNSLTLNERFSLDDDGEKNGGLVTITGNGDLPTPDRFYDISDTAFLQKQTSGGITTYNYTFNLPLFVQNVINGDIPGTLYLSSNRRTTLFDALKFGATDHPTNSIKLKVIYTKPN